MKKSGVDSAIRGKPFFDIVDIGTDFVGKIGKYDSLLRYQIRDEPPRELIGNWILVQRALAAFDPKRPAFSCFCHPDSLARVSAETTLAEAVFDIYPHHKGTPLNTLGGFESGMRTFTQASGDNPRWVVLQAFAVPGDSHWRYPTPEELKAVTWLSLASGVRGVFYFIYQYMPTYLHGMVDYDSTPRPIYEPCAELASKLTKLSPLLMSLKPGRPVDAEGDAHVSGFRDATDKICGCGQLLRQRQPLGRKGKIRTVHGLVPSRYSVVKAGSYSLLRA